MATIADIERRLAQIERELPSWRRRGLAVAARWEAERESLLEQVAPFKHITDPGQLVLLDHAMETGFRVRLTHGDAPCASGVQPFVLVGTKARPGGGRFPSPPEWSSARSLPLADEADFSKEPIPWRVRRERAPWD